MNVRRSSPTPRRRSVVDWSSIAFNACSACAYSFAKYVKFSRASSGRSSLTGGLSCSFLRILRQSVEIVDRAHDARAHHPAHLAEVRDVGRWIAGDEHQIGVLPLLDRAGALLVSHRPRGDRR